MRLPHLKRHVWAPIVAMSIVMVTLLVSGICRWSPLNCSYDDIDITTGRVRRARCLLYCEVWSRIEETWISRAVDNHLDPPAWRRVNTFSPGIRYSPYYLYHSAIDHIKTLEITDHLVAFSPEARLKVSRVILGLWQATAANGDVDDYVRKVSNTVVALHDQGVATVEAADIPDRS